MGSQRTIRIGTRGSALALAQAGLVARALDQAGTASEIVTIETAGDQRAPDTAWGEGAFVSAIEQAVLAGQVDVAVHSAKDVPTDEDPRLAIAAYLPREQPHDVLVVRAGTAATLDELPAGSVIGTDSPRRAGFLRAYRRDLEVRPLHGNVDTRLRKLDDGEADALVLAAAGLLRLGRADRIAQAIPPEIIPPAPGQGAIAMQIRADDEPLFTLLGDLDDRSTRLAVETERALLHATGGGCRSPIGALATVSERNIAIQAGFATLDGRHAALDRVSGPTAEAGRLAETLAARLVARRSKLPDAPRILVTRPAAEGRRLAGRLAEHGLAALVVPAIEVELLDGQPELSEAVARLDQYDWAIVTSSNGVRAARAAAARQSGHLHHGRWAAIGAATARELRAAGAGDIWQPSRADAMTLADELPLGRRGRVLWLHGDLADQAFAERLRSRGASVETLSVYHTIEGPAASAPLLAEALAGGPIAALVLASPSAARGLLELAEADDRSALLSIPAVVVGATTAAAARELGYSVAGTAAAQEAEALAELAAEIVAEAAAARGTTAQPAPVSVAPGSRA